MNQGGPRPIAAIVTNESDAPVDLCLLVRRGDVDAVVRAGQEHPQLLHRVRWSGVGPLHRAVALGNLEMTRVLLGLGADANERTAWGWYSPLHLACKMGHEPLIWLLLDHGARWGATDKAKRTPLHWAVRAGKASIAYRVDQQLHAQEKAAKAQALAAQAQSLAATGTPSLSSWC